MTQAALKQEVLKQAVLKQDDGGISQDKTSHADAAVVFLLPFELTR